MKMFKSFSLLIGFALCAMFISCDKLTETDASEILPDKVIWEPATTAEGTFITVSADAWENDEHLKSNFSGTAPIIYFENGIDLTGYKYLNIEAYCPDDGYHLLGFTGFSEEPHEKVARLQAMGSKEATVYQTDFGVNNKEWPDMSTGTFAMRPSTSNKINYICVKRTICFCS